MLAEAFRWAAIAALTAAALRFPTSGFWSLEPRRPLVLARVGVSAGGFRGARPS